jgi:hypothetical protein
MSREMENDSPELASPGAGLPLVHELVLKYLAFPILRRLVSWERALAMIEKEGRVILAEVLDVPEDLRFRRILVPRMMGIEDSSRHWSLAMTLDHLLIVSHGVLGLMAKLSRAEAIDVVVNTADVKPDSKRTANVERKFEMFLGDFRRQVWAHVADRATSRCHVHPWFGCLDPHGWLVMLAVHQWIHKRQIQEIRRRLAADYPAG